MAKGNKSAGGGSASCSTEQTGKFEALAFLMGRDLAVRMLESASRGDGPFDIEAKNRDGAPQNSFVLEYLGALKIRPELADGFSAVLSDYLGTGGGALAETYANLSLADMRGVTESRPTQPPTPLWDDRVLRSASAASNQFELIEDIRSELDSLGKVMADTWCDPDSYVIRIFASRLKLLGRILGAVNENAEGDPGSWRKLREQLCDTGEDANHG